MEPNQLARPLSVTEGNVTIFGPFPAGYHVRAIHLVAQSPNAADGFTLEVYTSDHPPQGSGIAMVQQAREFKPLFTNDNGANPILLLAANVASYFPVYLSRDLSPDERYVVVVHVATGSLVLTASVEGQ